MSTLPTDPPTGAAPFPPGTGADLLNQVSAALTRYVVLPSPEALTGVVLWIAASHAVPAWNCAPRLVIRAPEKRCGKSRLLDLVEALSHAPLMTTNASPSAVYRSIGEHPKDPPTLLIDEADAIFGPKAGDNEDLRGLLNAGHQRGRPTLRYDAGTKLVDRIETFAMAALAGIGAMPDTIEDRAVVIRMRRRAPGEDVQPYRVRRDGPTLAALRRRLNQWVRAHLDALTDAVPDMPVEDRTADTWEPLIALSDLAGGLWPDASRNAVLTLTADRDATTADAPKSRILADCRTAFHDADALPTADLLDRLRADPEAPWATYGPAGLTAMRLGNLLREYDITSHTLRFPTGQAKGYVREDFTDAWTRYLPTPDASPDVTPSAAGPTGQQPLIHAVAGEPYQPYQPHNPRSAPVRLEPWYGSSRTTPQAVPPLTCTNEAGTAGTASPATPRPAVCITCREPLPYDDGTHAHPTCATA